MEYTGAELLVEGLKAAGVRSLFGVAGSNDLPVLDVIYRQPGIRYYQSQHEQGGIYMANGYARTARAAGISLVSPGPGATNSLSGVAQAYYTSTPSILINIEETSRFAGLGPSQHHDLDALKVFSPVTKWAGKVSRIDRLLESLYTALRVALSGRKGPCYLGIDLDILDQKIQLDRASPPGPFPEPPPGNPRDIERMAGLLAEAERPLIVAGGGVNWSQAQEQVMELAGLLPAAIVSTTSHKGIIPEDHPLSLGTAGSHAIPPAIKAFQRTDLVLGIGCSFAYFKTVPWSTARAAIGPRTRVAHIDIDPTEIGKVYPTEAAVAGDARLVLQDLIAVLKQKKRHDGAAWSQEIHDLKTAWEKQTAPLKASGQLPVRTWRLLGDLRKALPREAIVGGESGGTGGWFEYAFEALAPCTIGGWHPLGAEVCEAMGVRVAAPDRPVVCITGDGSMMMTLAELATAAANDIPVLFVIRHNNAFGNMRKTQIKQFGSRFIGTVLPIPNLADVARDLGIRGERIETPEQIIPAVQRHLQTNKPTLLEIMCDNTPDELAPPHLEL
ncbi:MAG: thiamine pyrophosphate-binding protein [Chloroflexi bacterium]|nr:thiamine pyrophosphate-binding protein [Chloroflexota bacterium]